MVGITVEEALQLPELRQAVLLAGKEGIGRIITSVNIMEVPYISRFIKQGELLLTTTYPIRDDPETQASLVLTLAEQDLAALAIKPVELWLREIPRIMVEQADEMAFPLILLPGDASFNEIINPILGEILNRRATILTRNEEVHRNLTDIVLNGGSLSEIAHTLSSLLEAAVSIHSPQMRLLAFCPLRDDPAIPLGADKACALHNLVNDADKLASLVQGRTGPVELETDRGRRITMVHPVTVAREDYAYLIVWQSHQPPAPIPMNIVEQAATVIALEISKLRAVAEAEKRFRTILIEDLIQKKLTSRSDVLSKGELYGWDLAGAFTPLLVEIDDMDKLYAAEHKIGAAPRLLRKPWDVVASAVSRNSPGSITVDMSNRVLILHRSQQGMDSKASKSDAIKLAMTASDELILDQDATSSIGIGRQVDDIMDLSVGFNQAKQALEIGRRMNGSGSVNHFDDLGIFRILADNRDRPELSRFCWDFLGDLIEADKKSDSDLLPTLDVVLQCNGNMRMAARKMFVHYNTLRYRVGRIEEITGLDLDSADARLNLGTAIRLMKMLDL